MTPDQAKLFLKALGVKNIRNGSGGWVNASCPLARWTHKSAHDSTPSFGIRAIPGEHSTFHCFACKSGSIEELIQVLEMYLKDEAHTLDFQTARSLMEDELAVLPLPEYEEFAPHDFTFEEWPGWWLDVFPPVTLSAAAVAYLRNRRVSDHTMESQRLRWDDHRQMVVAPFFNVYGKLAGARGRTILDGKVGIEKHYDYRCSGISNTKGVLYNEQALELEGPIVTVEGQFDCWRVMERWPKVVSTLTAKPTYEKLVKMADSPRRIHIPDTDETGAESIVSYDKGGATIGIRFDHIILPKSVKDPDDCSADYLYDRIMETLGH